MCADIFAQTLEDQSKGRISPFQEASVSLWTESPPSRRFGVRQRSSKGTFKVRCIDDFAASKVKGLMRVSRRIRMGRLRDVLLACKIIIRAHPSSRLQFLKSDFKSAYRACPIAASHLKYSWILVREPKSTRVLAAMPKHCQHDTSQKWSNFNLQFEPRLNIGPAGGDREFVKNIFMYKVWTRASKWLV